MTSRSPPLGWKETTNEHLVLEVRVAGSILANIGFVDFIAKALAVIGGVPFVLSTPGKRASGGYETG